MENVTRIKNLAVIIDADLNNIVKTFFLKKFLCIEHYRGVRTF